MTIPHGFIPTDQWFALYMSIFFFFFFLKFFTLGPAARYRGLLLWFHLLPITSTPFMRSPLDSET